MMRWRAGLVVISSLGLPLTAFSQVPTAAPSTSAPATSAPGAQPPTEGTAPNATTAPSAAPTATPEQAAAATPPATGSAGPIDAAPAPAPEGNATTAPSAGVAPSGTAEPGAAPPSTDGAPPTASAQVPPPSPPAQPAPATPAPASAPTTNSPTPPATAWAWATPVPGADAPTPPGDTGTKKERPKRDWRGTELGWGHVVTTSALGVGRDYQSDAHQVYLQVLTLQLAYHPVTTKTFDFGVAIAPDVSVELTDSGQTTTRREPWLGDVPLIGSAKLLLVNEPKELLQTAAVGALAVIFPTSKASRAEGDILTLSPRLGLTQTFPVFGESAPVLSAMTVGATARYDHLFSEATTPVDDDLDLPAQDLSGRAITSDLLNGDQLAPNRLRISAFFGFGAELFGAPLDLTVSGFYESAQLAGVKTSTLELATGPVEITPADDARSRRPSAGVAAELAYTLSPEFVVSVGYQNRADLDSELNNPLHTPYATFVGGLTLRLDELYTTLGGSSEGTKTASLSASPW